MAESLSLFLVEDDDDVALLIRKGLERAHHHVLRCRTAADALIVLRQRPFDLVILDQMLPDRSGLELLGELERDGQEVPVLMITGHGDEALAARVLRAGVLDYLVKDDALAFLAELPKRVHESVTRHRLERQNRLLVQSLESASDGFVLVDRAGVIRDANRALLALTGYGREELVGRRPALFLGRDEAAPWPEAPAGGWQGEDVVRRKDGTRVPVSLSVSRIDDRHGNPTHSVGILRDVTETRKLERQLLQAQKMQSIGTLAGGVAHEFNNLLAGINGYAALALRELDGTAAEAREFLENVVALSERAALLTRQLLAFARKPALSRQRTYLPDLVASTVEMIRRTLHRNVELEVGVADPAAPLLVEADGNQLQHALINLAVNARDAVRVASACEAEASPIAVRLGGRHLVGEAVGFPQNVPPGDYVLLQVVDAGCGMSPDVLTQAVDPFFTTKDVGQGTGLGLSVVFGIVQAHHGYLQIESAPGVGSTMSIYLPRVEVVEAEPKRPAVSATPSDPGRPTRPLAILVVDDEEAVLDVVRRFLEIAGHRAEVAATGRDGLALLGKRSFDLVILDLTIPTEDAGGTFLELRRLAPGVPVVLCTGMPEAEPAPTLLAAGAAGLVRKPFRMTDLLDAVRRASRSADSAPPGSPA